MRQLINATILISITILQFRTMQSFGSPTNSYDSFTYSEYDNTGKISIEATTIPWDVVMNELYGIPLKTENTYVKTLPDNQPADGKTTTYQPLARTPTTNEQPLNISEIFYFREKVANYPDLSTIEHLLKKFDNYFETTNVLDTKSLLPEDEGNYVHLCQHVPFKIPAQEAENAQREKVLIVNDEKHVQFLEGEACGHVEDTPCGEYLKNFSEGYKPTCKTNFIFRKMVVLKESSATNSEKFDLVVDDIPVPGCCECVLKKPEY